MSIQLDSVIKRYPGNVTALNGVSVRVDDGEQVAIVGPSGSGKTTMLTILGTLERPTDGRVTVEDLTVQRASDTQLAGLRAHRIGFVFQTFHLQETTSVLDNVGTGLLYTGMPARQRRQASREALERVGLGHRIEFRPNQLSGGERQRVAIARAVAKRPAILLADEPTGNLDSQSGHAVLTLLHELVDEGSTLVLITHDERIAATFPRQLQMRDGEIIGDRRARPDDRAH
jgi:putative ABC transport system ATP-binding protein